MIDERRGRRCTEKARAAALEARRFRKRFPRVKQTLEVFVMRWSSGGAYGWEIRQFGGIVLKTGTAAFHTHAEAREDGGRALAEHLRNSPS